MIITQVRIKLMNGNGVAVDGSNEKLQAFCSIVSENEFVVRDLKIIEGKNDSFVAMPSRKLMDNCPACKSRNHLRARYCNNCGVKLNEDRFIRDVNGRAKLHADIAHPINSKCREDIQSAVLKAYQEEVDLASRPGYICAYDNHDSGHDNCSWG